MQIINQNQYIMVKTKIDPKTAKKIVDVLIAILTAIGGFLGGLGLQSCVHYVSNL